MYIVVSTHLLGMSTSTFDFDFSFRGKCDFPGVYSNLKVFLFFAGEWHGINFDQNYGDAAFHAVDVGRLAL